MKKIFGGINITWKKLIIFAIIAGVYTGVMAMLPIAKDTSFADITISFEIWILFGIFIIMNSKSAKDSALKCLVFFLISQPLVYLIQDVINHSNLFLIYYRNWIIWTILTIPMGFIGWYMKKDKWWGLAILVPVLLFLGIHYSGFLGETLYYFPHHLLSALFCIATMIIYPIFIFENKKIKLIGTIISLTIIIIMTIISFVNKTTYTTIILTNGGSSGAVFDDTYKAYLEDDKLGNVHIKYDDGLEDYEVEAEFNRAGKTNLILEDSNGNKTVFEIDVKRDRYDINKKESYSSIDNNNEQKAGDNNIWVDMITNEVVTWVEIAMKPNENGITEMQLDWSKIYGELNTGKYRIIKYNGLSTLYSESFTIK